MTLYRWPDSILAQMEYSAAKATLRPREDADAALPRLRNLLSAKGIASFIDTEAGRDVLILPAPGKVEKLLGLLAQNGVTGTHKPQVIANRADPTRDKGLGHFIKTEPMLMAAAFYNLTNVTWIVSGIQRARHNPTGKFTKADLSEMLVGVTYCVGDILLAFYGKDKTKPPMLAFSDALTAHLKEHGITLPESGTTPHQLHERGFFTSIHEFIGSHIVPIKAISKSAGGAFSVVAATKPGNVNAGKMVNGMLITSGWLATFLLDKPPPLPYALKETEDSPHSSGLVSWFADNPRQHITAPLTIAGTPIKLWGSWNEARKFSQEVLTARDSLAGKSGADLAAAQKQLRYAERKQYDWAWNVVGTCSMLVGNYLFGLTGHGSKENAVDDMQQFEHTMLVVAANTLASVPAGIQAQAIQESAAYIAGVKGITHDQKAVAAAIAEQIQHLRLRLKDYIHR